MNGRLIQRSQLTAAQRRQMHGCLSRWFDGVDHAQFERDLREKTQVILLESGRRLVGFTTLQLYPFEHEGRRFTVVYSGDTIVSPEAWAAG